MQLTSNIAVFAAVVASTAPSVFSLPFNVPSNSIEAREYELDMEAREIAEFEAREFEDLELAARDLIEEYYEAREVYDELDARSFDDLNYLDARDAPAAPPAATSATATPSGTPTPSATSATPAAGTPAPPVPSTSAPTDAHVHHARDAHIPSVLIRALTDEHHPKLKHYAEIQLHIFNTLVELSDGELNDNGVKESAEVEKLAKEILQLKRWHRHHLHHHGHHGHKHGAHHHEHEHSAHAEGDKKDGVKPAHEKHDGAKDATAPTPASGSATPGTSGAPHHGHHHDLYHAKIHELKIGSHKADRYLARARLHKDRLHLIALGPNGDNDEAYEAAVKHEKQWLERHQKMAAHLHHHGHAADPSATGAAAGAPSATSTSSAAPTATGTEKKADKPAEPAASKTAQGVKRRALRRRGFF